MKKYREKNKTEGKQSQLNSGLYKVKRECKKTQLAESGTPRFHRYL